MKENDMATLNIITSESDEPIKFDVDSDLVDHYAGLLRDPNEVFELTARNGARAYIPVRHITYLAVTEG